MKHTQNELRLRLEIVIVAGGLGAVSGAITSWLLYRSFGGAFGFILAILAWLVLYWWKPRPTWGEAIACGLIAPVLMAAPSMFFSLVDLLSVWYVTFTASIGTGVAVKLLTDRVGGGD